MLEGLEPIDAPEGTNHQITVEPVGRDGLTEAEYHIKWNPGLCPKCKDGTVMVMGPTAAMHQCPECNHIIWVGGDD